VILNLFRRPRWPRYSVAEAGPREPGHGREAELRAVRRGLPGDPRRCRLAGAGVRLGRWVALLRRPRRGCLCRDVRRAAAARLRPVLGSVNSGTPIRPCSTRSPRPRARGTTYGRPTEGEVRLAEVITRRARFATGPFRVIGNRAAMSVHPARSRRDRPGPGREVRRLLPRAQRRASRRRRKRCGHSRAPGLGRRAGECRVGHDRRAYNEVPEIDESVACVIVERWLRTWGWWLPSRDISKGLRAACDHAGALLIFDE